MKYNTNNPKSYNFAQCLIGFCINKGCFLRYRIP